MVMLKFASAVFVFFHYNIIIVFIQSVNNFCFKLVLYAQLFKIHFGETSPISLSVISIYMQHSPAKI